ncbi:MAG: hypothetical protein DUW69_002654, partial [Verrucomicrobia bacterium]
NLAVFVGWSFRCGWWEDALSPSQFSE